MKILEYQRYIDSERETWRQKISDIDQKYKLAENRRT